MSTTQDMCAAVIARWAQPTRCIDMRVAADGLLHLINDILELSKLEMGRVELETAPFNLRCVGLSLALDYGGAAPWNY